MKLKELQILRYAMVSLKSVQPSESLQIDFIFRLFAILIIISYYLVNYFPKFVFLHSYLFLHMCSNLYFRTLWSLSWNLISCWARAVSEYLGLHRRTEKQPMLTALGYARLLPILQSFSRHLLVVSWMFFSCAHCKGSVWLVVWYGFAWVHNFWRSFRPRRTGCQWCYWLYFLSAFSMSNFYIQYVWKYAAMLPHQQVECLSKSVCERDLFLGTAGQGITLWHQFLGNKGTILARDILEVRL